MFNLNLSSDRESFLRSFFEPCAFLGCSKEVSLFIACQFALESNFGKSLQARQNFNFCGMKSPILRPTFNLNRARTFSSYPDSEFCLMDYFLYLAWSRCSLSRLQDVKLFKKHLTEKKYCTDPDYLPSIDRLYNQYYYLINP